MLPDYTSSLEHRRKLPSLVKDFFALFLILLGLVVIVLQTIPVAKSWFAGVLDSFYESAIYSIPVSSKFLQALAKPSYFDPGASYMSVLAQSAKQNLTNVKIDTKYSKLMHIDIPSVGIKQVPISPNIAGDKPSEYKQALRKGVAHLKGTPLPGDGGISIIYGHSGVRSILARKLPDYLAFTLLEKVNLGDAIIIKRDNKVLKYVVIAKKIVKPYALDFLSKLDTHTEKLALITCWPIGLGSSRLVIIAQYYE